MRARPLARCLALFFVLAAWPALAAGPLPLAGTWEGSLNAGGATLRLVLHMEAAADGYHATLDSLDQGAMGLKVDSAVVKDGRLVLLLTDIKARFSGTIDEKAGSVSGKWSQNESSFPLVFRRPAPPAAPPAAEAASPPLGQPGTSRSAGAPLPEYWSGSLDAGGVTLRVAFHLKRDDKGALVATMDSLDQGAMGIPFDTAALDGNTLRLECKKIMGVYTGTLDDARTQISGTWAQGPATLPLVLKAGEKPAVVARSQDPKKPYPYVEEDVSYENKAAGVKLAGTFTKPKGAGPFPAVLLITGSGPEDRNETVFGHHPFLVLSDHLTRKGIAVLRVDDRGVGGSTLGPKGAKATSEDFAGDVLAGVEYLKTRGDVEKTQIGLIGHSEGGMIAPMAAVRSKDVAFLVLMAGTAVPGDEILVRQTELIIRASGGDDAAVSAASGPNRGIYDAMKQEKDDAAAEKRVRDVLQAAGLPKEQVDLQTKQVLSPWFRFFVSYDPRPTLAKVTVPLLAINGARDVQVDPKQNLPEIRKALDGAGHKDHTIVELPGLNHLFQTCKTCSVGEYGSLDETIAPLALETLSDWIVARTKKP